MLVIQMHKGGGLFSRLIRWFTRAEYSHVSAWFWDANDPHGGFVIEAMEGEGVRTFPADHHRAAREAGTINCYALRTPLTTDEQGRLHALMERELGKGYDWLGVIRFVSRRRHKGADNKWFCSEIVAYAFEEIGRPLSNRPSWQMTPGDVAASTELVRTDNPEAHI